MKHSLNAPTPPQNFQSLLFERVNLACNEHRFYYLGWQQTLIDAGAIVRIYGRKGGFQRMLTPIPFESLAAAWPTIQKHIKTRLSHGYRIVHPV
jgi:predicted DNA-binding WGR domain protein